MGRKGGIEEGWKEKEGEEREEEKVGEGTGIVKTIPVLVMLVETVEDLVILVLEMVIEELEGKIYSSIKTFILKIEIF